MANIKSAKKRARQSEKRRLINSARKSVVKTAIKKVLQSIAQNDSAENTKELFLAAQTQIARAKGKGVIPANTASRKISKLAKKCNAVSTTSDEPKKAVVKKAPKKATTVKKAAPAKKAVAKKPAAKKAAVKK